MIGFFIRVVVGMGVTALVVYYFRSVPDQETIEREEDDRPLENEDLACGRPFPHRVKMLLCPKCRGGGFNDCETNIACSVCGGKGEVPDVPPPTPRTETLPGDFAATCQNRMGSR